MTSQNPDNTTPISVTPISDIPTAQNPTNVSSETNPKSTSSSSKNPSPAPIPNPSLHFQNEEKYPHANTPSVLTEENLRNICVRYQIPDTHLLRAPNPTDWMYHRPEGWTAMHLTLLEKGVRLPLYAFVITLLGFMGVGFFQLVPNSYIHILAFIAFCHEIGIPPSIDFFFTLFRAGKSWERGFKMLNKQSLKPNARFEKRPLMDTHSSNKGWHKDWFFVKGPEFSSIPDWTTVERLFADFDDIAEERVREMTKLLEKLPMKE